MAYDGGLPLGVVAGGTGRATLTTHDLLVGNGTTQVTLVAPSATSGVPLISQGASSDPAYGTAVVAGGGTGIVTTTAYAPICGGTTATGNWQAATTGFSTSGYVLTSNGNAALPSFQAVSPGTITQYDVLVGAASSQIASVGPGSAGQVLQSAGNASNPAYSTPTYPSASGSAGQILRADGTNNVYSTATYPNTTGANTMLISTSANVVTTATYQATTTFTPTLKLGGGTTGITYTTQVGTYAQIGSVVFINIYIVLSSKGSSTGAATITGLPVTSNSTTNNNQIINGSIQAASFFTNTYQGMGYIAANSTTLQVYATYNDNGSFTAFNDTNFGNTTVLIYSGSYLA